MTLIDTSSDLALSTTFTQHLESPFFRVESFGFLKLTSTEQHPESRYPTANDVVPAGWFTLEVDNGIYGDFNGDGLQDLVIHPMLFPHTTPRATKIEPLFLLQTPSGSFQPPDGISITSPLPDKYLSYRMGIGDFNGDSIDDITICSSNRPIDTQGNNIPETPLTIYGGLNSLSWTDTYKNLPLFQGAPNWLLGYSGGHSMAVGDFNGDGLSDWFSAGYVAYSTGDNFIAERITPNANAVKGLNGWTSEWTWPNTNACTAADFNEDGISDLAYSGMPARDDGTYNGGDLYVVLGSKDGLKDGLDVIQETRTNTSNKNIGTNYMVAADFNGDAHQDLLLIEHGWVSDSGDSSKYYSEGKFRIFIGDGHGNLSESVKNIVDPYSGHRGGEGNLFAMDVNGDGWIDLVSVGYMVNFEDSWTSSTSKDSTCIFINDRGTLKYVPKTDLAFVEPFQFKGEEQNESFLQTGTQRMYPVDIGNDGLIDFVGFVNTPLHNWPQTEQQYTYAYISKAIAPLGRMTGNEILVGTLSNDKIYGYEGNDVITGENGDDILNGGGGVDTAIYSGQYQQYQIDVAVGAIVDTQVNRDGKDTLVNIERLHFSDTNVALDIGKGEIGGEAYRIYKAAFDRAPDAGGLGFWINAMDDGASLTSVAGGFIASPEFKQLYGANVTDRDFVTKVYKNVLDRNPDQSGYDFWLGAMGRGATRADILASFSESPENIGNVADLIANGIQYEAWVV